MPAGKIGFLTMMFNVVKVHQAFGILSCGVVLQPSQHFDFYIEPCHLIFNVWVGLGPHLCSSLFRKYIESRPVGKWLTSWLLFVMSNRDVVTFPLVS